MSQNPPPLPPLRLGPYVPHDTLNETGKAAMVGFTSGFLVSAINNALQVKNVGPFYALTHGKLLMGLGAAAPAAYTFVSRSTMNLMEEESSLGAVLGGFAAGGVLGLPYRRLPIVMGFGAALAVTAGTAHLFGGSLATVRKSDDEFERKEIVRRTTRIPIEQTVAELGESRDIRPPGYEERRRQRMQEKYGVEINPVKATVDGSM